jgi:erythromycin esterase-like protein
MVHKKAERTAAVEAIAAAAEPLPGFDDPGFGQLFDRFANKRVVLLGEASHGTAEFYRARAAITRHLVAAHGFRIVAVEADWPDAAAIDRYVRHRPAPPHSEPPFQRFPTWMWRNVEIDALIDWLRHHNEGINDRARRAGFYGLDIYNLSDSIGAVLDYLDGVDPEAARVARERYGCLTPWRSDPATYGHAVLTRGYRECEQGVVEQCRELLQRRLDYVTRQTTATSAEDRDDFLDAAQNARLIAAAERYYRVMYYGDSESWNLRDTHMFETLEHLLDARGPDTRAVVWAHNSHIGDARFTAMGKRERQLNLGQLCRERFGDEAALIGFGTHTGTVAAAHDWGEPMQVMDVRPSHPDSYERLCHEAALPPSLLDLREAVNRSLHEALLPPRLERFIGVIYRPKSELSSHYAEAVLPQQFDAYVWFDQSQALTPLGPQHGRSEAPETYPFGL